MKTNQNQTVVFHRTILSVSPRLVTAFFVSTLIFFSVFLAAPAVAQSNCSETGGDAACRGFESRALGNTSTAIGIQVNACVDQTAAFGLRTWAETPRAFVIGQYNMRATTQPMCQAYTLAGQEPLFIVGAGLGPGNPTSEQHRNALTVLKNGTTVIGLVRSPNSSIGPLSALNVVGNAYIDSGLKIGDGMLMIGRGSPTGFRDLGFWVEVAFGGRTCEKACGNGVCLAAYIDQEAVARISCEVTNLNKNCLCAGRP